MGFGRPLPDDSAYAMAAFAGSPLARGGRPMCDRFRWEVQSWMVRQFLHGEQGALVVAARLVEVVPDVDSKLNAASQAADESRQWDVTELGMQIMVEALVLAAFRLADREDLVLAAA